MKICSKAPDDYEQENFEQEIENRFMEEEGRRNERRERRARPEGKGKALPVVPRILGYRKLPYRRSYKHIRSLHDDRNEHFLALIAHAAQKMEWKANRGEGKGKKGEGKGEGGKGEGKGGGKMQQQGQEQHLHSLHCLLPSLSHSSHREERHGHGEMADRDRRGSRECYGETRKDRRDRRESMQGEARREEEATDSQRRRPIPYSLRA